MLYTKTNASDLRRNYLYCQPSSTTGLQPAGNYCKRVNFCDLHKTNNNTQVFILFSSSLICIQYDSLEHR